jgi:uncharacterized ferredoxin-like protein
MLIKSKQAEEAAVMELAHAICAAARTAPKACGVDILDTAILTGEEKKAVTNEMRRLGKELGEAGSFFIRDADNVDGCSAVVLVGAKHTTRGLGEVCSLCGFKDCADSGAAGAACVFTPMDLGIALGSAVAIAADHRIDNRIMFTIGKAAESLKVLGEYKMIMGIPLATTGKSPFFDRP